MKQLVRFCSTGLLMALTTTGCFAPPDFSLVPEIAFNSLTKFEVIEPFSRTRQDSVVITIEFKDGDGDLGETAEGRKDPRYDTWGNYELRTFRRVQGNRFEEVILPANAKIFFPPLKPDNRRGPIEGRLDYSVFFPYSRNARLNTVKFQIRVRDRAFNASNIIETDTLSVPLLLQ
ncbi:MAG: hypothetical protein ACK4GN_00705 [Runella sp.]